MTTFSTSAFRVTAAFVAWLCCGYPLCNGATAVAQAPPPPNPAITSAVCTSERTIVGGGMPDTYKIKGEATAGNMPNGTESVTLLFKFQKRPNADPMTAWGPSNVPDKEITKVPVNGAVSMETTWSDFSPAGGEQWRVLVSGSYKPANAAAVNLVAIGAIPITPKP